MHRHFTDSHEMAHTWSFNMRNPDEIFRLQKADDDPNTPWTITSTECGSKSTQKMF